MVHFLHILREKICELYMWLVKNYQVCGNEDVVIYVWPY